MVTMMEPDSDRSLVARIRSGDDSAATELYERYASRLLGLAKHQVSPASRSIAEPDDIVQSAFKSLFRGVHSGTYDAPDGASLWNLLAVIAIHKVRRRITRSKSVAAISLVPSNGDSEIVPMSESVSPQEFEASIREAIEGLTPSEQEVVLLRVQGYHIEEISERLQRSGRTIERTLQRIREKLAGDLEHQTLDLEGEEKHPS